MAFCISKYDIKTDLKIKDENNAFLRALSKNYVTISALNQMIYNLLTIDKQENFDQIWQNGLSFSFKIMTSDEGD